MAAGTEMRAEAETVRGTIDCRPLAESRMNAMLEIVEDGKFRDPALEEEFQQWRRQRSKNTKR